MATTLSFFRSNYELLVVEFALRFCYCEGLDYFLRSVVHHLPYNYFFYFPSLVIRLRTWSCFEGLDPRNGAKTLFRPADFI